MHVEESSATTGYPPPGVGPITHSSMHVTCRTFIIVEYENELHISVHRYLTIRRRRILIFKKAPRYCNMWLKISKLNEPRRAPTRL